MLNLYCLGIARARSQKQIEPIVLAMPAELGHARLHASRYVYYALIHIDIRTLHIKIKI